MTLTPIKVRRKRKSSTALVGRPGKRNEQPSRPSRRSERVLKKRYSIILREPPLEVLEKIYIFSQNLDFPSCSPYIDRMLSGRSTRINMVIAAFHPTWDGNFGVHRWELKYVNPARVAGREPRRYITGYAEFQTAVLECAWAKIDILLEAQQNWYRMYGKGRWYSHPEIKVRGPEHYAIPSLEHSKIEGGFDHFHSATCFEYDFERYDSPGSAFAQLSPWHLIDVDPDTRLPDNLVSGPWTDEMMRRLFWLRRGGCRMSETSHTWEIKLEAVKNAVEDARQRGGFISIRLLRMLLTNSDFSRGVWPEEVRTQICKLIRNYIDPTMPRVRILFLADKSFRVNTPYPLPSRDSDSDF